MSTGENFMSAVSTCCFIAVLYRAAIYFAEAHVDALGMFL